jgi:hypothetical protein
MEQLGTPVITLIQMVTLIGSILCFVLLTIWATQNKQKWLYLVPIYIFVLNAFLFYLYLLLDNFSNVLLNKDYLFYTEWSSYIRLQALATVLLYCYMFIDWKKIRCGVKQLWHKNSGCS